MPILISRTKDDHLLTLEEQCRPHRHSKIGEEGWKSIDEMQQMNRGKFIRVVVIVAAVGTRDKPPGILVLRLPEALHRKRTQRADGVWRHAITHNYHA